MMLLLGYTWESYNKLSHPALYRGYLKSVVFLGARSRWLVTWAVSNGKFQDKMTGRNYGTEINKKSLKPHDC